MANPEIITCEASGWTLVAENIMTGMIHIKKTGPIYLQTYRETGDSAPTDLSDAVPFESSHMVIQSDIPIDVYVYCNASQGLVRVDL